MKTRAAKQVLLHGLLIVLACIILFPIAITFKYSFFSPDEIKAFMETRKNYDTAVFMAVKFSPAMFSLRQYYAILIEDMTILKYFVNSVMYTVLILTGQALVIPMMAYALSRFKFFGRDAIFFSIIVLMLLPYQVTMVPNMLTIRALKLMDTIWAVVFPMVISPFYVFLIRQFMAGLPAEMMEAAQIDGAGTVRCFFYMVLPICRPILGAAAALSFADCWNMVEQPIAYLTSNTHLYPLSVVFGQLNQKSMGIEFAGATLYALPALFIYMYFQQDILAGVKLGELK